MQVGSAYSGLQAFDMVSKSIEIINDLNKNIVQEDVNLSNKLVNAAVTEQVSEPSAPDQVHRVDVRA